MDKKQQHSPISRRAFLDGIGAKAAAVAALGVVAVQEVVRASGDTDARKKRSESSQADGKAEGRPSYLVYTNYAALGYSDYYSDYYNYSDYCGKRGGVAYAGLALLIARACGRSRGKSKVDDHEDSAED